MALREIIEVPDPRLKVVSDPVTVFDEDLRTLVTDMFETMYAAPGIGLAAIQVGVPLRVLVIDLQESASAEENGGEIEDEDAEPVKNPRTFINPELFDPSDALNTYSEGCLSVPEIYVDIDRPAAIGVRWQDLSGARHEELIDGMLATCLQHEMDHLEGIVLLDYLSRLKRQMVLKKLEKLRQAA